MRDSDYNPYAAILNFVYAVYPVGENRRRFVTSPGENPKQTTAFSLRRRFTAVRVLAVLYVRVLFVVFFFPSSAAEDGLRGRGRQPRDDVHAKERTGRAAVQTGPAHVRGKPGCAHPVLCTYYKRRRSSPSTVVPFVRLQLHDTKGQLRCRDQRTVELEAETEMLKEQQVRQNSIIASLRNRIKVRYHTYIYVLGFTR